MSEQDPPRLLDDPSTEAPVRAALESLDAAPPPYDALVAARVAARVAAAPVAVAPWVKAAVVSVLALSLAVPATRYARARRAAPAVTSATQTTPTRPVDVAESQRNQRPLELVAENLPPALEPRSVASTPRVRALPSAARSVESERVERDLLADAQRALERDHDPQRALSLVAEHRRRFARSPLDEERSYLALRAHARLGERAAIERVGAAFLQRFPTSIYASAARRLLGSAP